MRWVIPEDAPLVQGVPPSFWDGRPLHLRLDPIRLTRLEPILRRMSHMTAADSYAAAASALALFAQAVEVVAPALLAGGKPSARSTQHRPGTRPGKSPVRAEVRAAMELIEERLVPPGS